MALKFEYMDTNPRPYLFVTKKCPMNPADAIKTAMGQAFAEVMSFMESNDIRPAGPALSVYYTFDPQQIEFRSGFFVSANDAARATGQVRADQTPAAHVLTFTHTGPYEGLRDSYGQMMKYLAQQGKKVGAPTWEVYVDDPDSTPAEKLRTEIFVSLE